MKNDKFGDRMKMYEKVETGRKFLPYLPIIARMDGRGFHRFAKKLNKPFDDEFRTAMENVTKKLVEETGALVGYTQSDEISLLFYSDNPKSQVFFDGKIFKMTSILAAMTTMYFNNERVSVCDDAMFDARVFQVPTKMEAVNEFLFREFDATRNSITAAAQSVYSHKELHKKNTKDMMDMLMEKGINWSDYSDRYKRGTYFRKEHHARLYRPEEIEKLPPKHEARTNPLLMVKRSEVLRLDIPPLAKVTNRVDVFFNEMFPIVDSEDDNR
jgi:tRNA(His) guanylyltransferase